MGISKKHTYGKSISRREILKYSLYGGLAAGLAPSLWLSGCSKRQQGKKPNIILIILDTVRADGLGVLTRKGPFTPHIDDLSQQSTTFLNAFAPSPWTVPSHASIFTGHYSHKHNAVHDHFHLSDSFKTMAEILKSLGYVTGGFTCNAWLRVKSGMEQGFDTYEEVYEKPTKPKKTDKGAAKATKRVVKWLNQRADDRKPFFLFVNYMEAHRPYKPPARVLYRLDSTKAKPGLRFFSSLPEKLVGLYNIGRLKLTPDELARVQTLYCAEIAYLDEQIGTLISCLRTHGPLDNTILIITSDHGENLGEHNLIGHEFTLFDTVLHVPLIVRFPSALPPGELVEAPVSLVDILPTILEILGDHARLAELKGVSLLRAKNAQANENRGILAEYSRPKTLINRHMRKKFPQVDLSHYDVSLKALRKGGFKYMVSSRGEEFLYNVVEDPAELADVSASFPEQMSRLRTELTELTQTVGPIEDREDKSEPFTPEQRRQLESLGYL